MQEEIRDSCLPSGAAEVIQARDETRRGKSALHEDGRQEGHQTPTQRCR